MKACLTLLVLLGLVALASAAETDSGGLVFTAHLAKDGTYSKAGLSTGDRATKIYVTFTNTSMQEVSVITGITKARMAPRGEDDPGSGRTLLCSRHDFIGWPNLVEVIPAASDLKIVTLRPGESAGVIVEHEFPPNVNLIGFGFQYIVSERLGRRFNTWHGTANTVLTDRYKIAYDGKE